MLSHAQESYAAGAAAARDRIDVVAEMNASPLEQPSRSPDGQLRASPPARRHARLVVRRSDALISSGVVRPASACTMPDFHSDAHTVERAPPRRCARSISPAATRRSNSGEATSTSTIASRP